MMSAPAMGFPLTPHPEETKCCSSDRQNKPTGEVCSRFSLLYNEGDVTESERAAAQSVDRGEEESEA